MNHNKVGNVRAQLRANNSRAFRAFRCTFSSYLMLPRCTRACVCARADGFRFQLLVGAARADYLPAHAGALRGGKLLPVWPENYVPAELRMRIHLLDNDSIEAVRRSPEPKARTRRFDISAHLLVLCSLRGAFLRFRKFAKLENNIAGRAILIRVRRHLL